MPRWPLLLSLFLACEPAPPRLRVDVCGDVPGPLDALRVTVRDEDRVVRYAGVSELARPDDAPADAALDASVWADAADLGGAPAACPAALSTHVSLPVPKGRGWVEVIGLERGVEIVRAEVRAHGAGTVRVALWALCAGVQCREGQTCGADGACALVPEAAAVGPCPPPPPCEGS